MPYTTVVAGTVITASWGNMIRDQVVTPFADAATRTAQVTSPVEGMVSYLSDTKTVHVHNGSQHVQMTPSSALVAASETSSNTGYVDLATPGPAVTVNTGTAALVMLTAIMSSATGENTMMSFAVSGATTVAASDSFTVRNASTNGIQHSSVLYVTGLTGGANTFTAKYRMASAVVGTWGRRSITVFPLML